MDILPMAASHKEKVLSMMQVFYASPAVSTNGSPEIFQADFDACVSDSPYLEGYVFADGERIFGYGMVAKSFATEYGCPCIWFEDIYLEPDYRNKGFAGQYFAYIEEKYPNCLFRLEAEDDNLPALRCYYKNGFEKWPYIELKKGR